MDSNLLDGFIWGTGKNPAGVPVTDMGCVREALCLMMHWNAGGPEWRSIPPGPPGTDLRRLCEEKPELGLRFHSQGDENVAGTQAGIVIGEVQTTRGIIGHAAYADEIGSIADSFINISGVITRR